MIVSLRNHSLPAPTPRAASLSQSVFLASSFPELRAEDHCLALVIGLGSPKRGGGGSGVGEPQVLQEVELLIKWLLPTLEEGDGELQGPRKQWILKETRPLSDPIKEEPRYIPGFFTSHTLWGLLVELLNL